MSEYAITFVGGLYLTIGVSGALSFGLNVDGNVLNNFPVSPLIVLFKCGFLLCIALSFPLVVYPSRISLNSLYLVSLTAFDLILLDLLEIHYLQSREPRI